MTVTDTGPLVVLAKLNRLELLAELFHTVIVPAAVYHEAVTVGKRRGYPDANVLELFLEQTSWPIVSPKQISPHLHDAPLGLGEREAITLALEYRTRLLIDDQHARRAAHSLGIATRGSLGVLAMAYRSGHLTRDELDHLLTLVARREDIWIHPALCQRVRKALLDEEA